MKKNRKITSLLIAACLTVPVAFGIMPLKVSAGTNSIIVDTTGSDYTHSGIAAYQIFQGTYDSGNSNLTVTGWGDGIDDVVGFINALKADSTFGSGTSNSFYSISSADTDTVAAAVADKVASFNTESGKSKAEAFAKTALQFKSSNSITTLTNQITGLDDGYYVIEDKGTKSGADSWSLGMLQVAGGTSITVTPKLGIPSVTKEVKENGNDAYEGYNDVADYCIGDTVPFKIIGKLPDNLAQYNHYYYCLTDTLGTAFDTVSDITVTIGGNTITVDGKNCRSSFDSGKLTVSFEDIKSAYPAISKNDDVIVTYNAKLNSNAAIGVNGNPSSVVLEYTNNPNEAYSPNMGDTNKDKSSSTGTTPVDKVIVFTYKLDVKKIDGVTGAGLADAEFTLKNSSNKFATASGGVITGWVALEDDATKFKSASDGTFSIIGLDDGTYSLNEIAAPSGYNQLASAIPVIINSTTINGNTWNGNAASALTELKVTVDGHTSDGVLADGSVSIDIKNNKGTTLPTTGGIGTRLFYILGGILVIGSGAALVIKKRMDKEEK